MSKEHVSITIKKYSDSKSWEYVVYVSPHGLTGSARSLQTVLRRIPSRVAELQRIAALEKKTRKSRVALQKARRTREHRLAD